MKKNEWVIIMNMIRQWVKIKQANSTSPFLHPVILNWFLLKKLLLLKTASFMRFTQRSCFVVDQSNMMYDPQTKNHLHHVHPDNVVVMWPSFNRMWLSCDQFFDHDHANELSCDYYVINIQIMWLIIGFQLWVKKTHVSRSCDAHVLIMWHTCTDHVTCLNWSCELYVSRSFVTNHLSLLMSG